MFEYKKFNNIINLGDHCSTAFMLIFFNLRKNSQPFDWIVNINPQMRGGGHFLQVAEILKDRFCNFFDKDDFEQYDDGEKNRDSKELKYLNKKTGFLFSHDFYIDKTFARTFDDVKEKYSRRIKRVLKFLDTKDCNNLLIFLDCNHEKYSQDDIKDSVISAFYELKKYFKSNLSLVYFCENHKIDYSFDVQELSKDVIFVSYNQRVDGFIRYYARYYSLKNFINKYICPKSNTLKSRFIMFIINFIPSKALRKKIREAYRRKIDCYDIPVQAGV